MYEETKNLIKILHEDLCTEVTEVVLESIDNIMMNDMIGGIPDRSVNEVIEAIKKHPLHQLKSFSLRGIFYHY